MDVEPKIKELSAVYGLASPTLRRYSNKDGVDIWNPAAVDKHVSDQQRVSPGYVGLKKATKSMEALLKTKLDKPKATKRSKSEDLSGVAETLRRLEEAEPKLYADWLACKEVGDLTGAKQTHDEWTKTSKTLLDYDLKLDASRKEMGEVISLEVLDRLLAKVGSRMIWSAKNQARLLWKELRPLLTDDIHPELIVNGFLQSAYDSVEESRRSFLGDEAVVSVAERFLAKLEAHLVVDEVSEEDE